MIRISSGLLKGLMLKTPKDGDIIRPSSSRLRQSIFNVLRNHESIFENAVIADLFSGTGAIGIEALSEGAVKAVFVDSSKVSLSLLSENLKKVEHSFISQKLETPDIEVLPYNIEKAYAKLPACNIIFADPPYRKKYFEKLIELEAKENKLLPNGVLVFEEASDVQLPLEIPHLKLLTQKSFSESTVYFFQKI